MLLRGALVALDPLNPVASVNVFQYNPNTLTRRLTPAAPEAGAARTDRLRLTGAPQETISLDIEVDATDGLEASEPPSVALGVHPQLAALEMVMYPKSFLVILNTALMASGFVEVVPAEQPLTLFVWGAARVLPVRVTSISVTEVAHDHQLNPIRAKASLGLSVLTYNDLPITHPGYSIFLVHQVAKEVMAVIGSAANVAGGLSASGGLG